MSQSVAEAMEAGFLPALDKDHADMFTLSELLLYRHAQDHRLLTRDILGYPSLYGDILGLSTRRFLSFRCSRIAGTPVYWALRSLRLFEFRCEARGKTLAEKM